MRDVKNSEHLYEQRNYNVSFARRADVGEEWNLIEWNRKHHEIDCHRLYLRTDNGDSRAVLHLIDGDVELLPGRIYFIPAFSVLQSEIHGKMNKFYIHFRSGSFALGLYRYLSGHYSVPADEISVRLFETVVENYAKNTEDAHLKVQGAMNLLLSDFFAEPYVNHQGIVKFEPVLRYIEENYKQNILIADLARILNISPIYFSNSFKSAFHVSPRQYILNKRLTESQQLLLETDMSIKEIAYATGFDNENYFSELFRAKTGVSARQFRKRALPREQLDRSAEVKES